MHFKDISKKHTIPQDSSLNGFPNKYLTITQSNSISKTMNKYTNKIHITRIIKNFIY